MYIFNGTYWKPDDKQKSQTSNFIDRVFLHDLISYSTKKMNYWNTQLNNAEAGVRDNANAKIKDINAFIGKVNNNLRNNHFRTSYITDIGNKLTNNELEWNINPYLFAFNNAIYDLEHGDFIEPNPNDYINMTCGYDYDFKYDMENVKELNEIIDKIFDNETKDYYLQVLSTGLCGIQLQKIFIANGRGGNGKSLINSLAMKTFGSYAYKLPTGVLLQPIKLGGNPDVANMDGKRFVLFQEPDSNQKLCCSVFKEITGGEALGVRFNHSNKCGIKLKLTLVGECNDLPMLDEVNDAVNRRLHGGIIPFKSKFVDKYIYDRLEDDEKVRVYIGNPECVGPIFQDGHKQALFHILTEHFKLYMKDKLNNIPSSVVHASSTYMAISDDIYDWFIENYERDDNEMVFVKDIFNKYRYSLKYMDMTKQQKRKYDSEKKFTEKIETNVFLQKNFREKDKYWNKQRHKKPFMAGWKEKKEANE
jgi:P4 family phage/plasmid primase-like protien